MPSVLFEFRHHREAADERPDAAVVITQRIIGRAVGGKQADTPVCAQFRPVKRRRRARRIPRVEAAMRHGDRLPARERVVGRAIGQTAEREEAFIAPEPRIERSASLLELCAGSLGLICVGLVYLKTRGEPVRTDLPDRLPVSELDTLTSATDLDEGSER